MATLNNIANALKSTTSSSCDSSVGSVLDKLVKKASKTFNPNSGIIKPIPTTPNDFVTQMSSLLDLGKCYIF